MAQIGEQLNLRYSRMARVNRLRQNDSLRKALGLGDFLNYGYWTPGVQNWESACEALLERLLAHIPEKTGSILDVACGLGANAQHLQRYYPESSIIGINISADQVNYCRRKMPNATFRVMRAEKMDFEDNSVDNILCVEAALHFDTRLDFFKEANRVLKPSGSLILSDVFADLGTPGMPEANRIESVDGYRSVLAEAGFGPIFIEDATQQSVMRRTEVTWNKLQELYDGGEITKAIFDDVKRKLYVHRRVMSYVLAAARKP